MATEHPPSGEVVGIDMKGFNQQSRKELGRFSTNEQISADDPPEGCCTFIFTYP